MTLTQTELEAIKHDIQLQFVKHPGLNAKGCFIFFSLEQMQHLVEAAEAGLEFNEVGLSVDEIQNLLDENSTLADQLLETEHERNELEREIDLLAREIEGLPEVGDA